MKTYNTVAIETDINGVDSNEELTALFARALELCETAKLSEANSYSSNTQYLSLHDVTYCIRNTRSVDLNPIPLPDVEFHGCLESVQADGDDSGDVVISGNSHEYAASVNHGYTEDTAISAGNEHQESIQHSTFEKSESIVQDTLGLDSVQQGEDKSRKLVTHTVTFCHQYCDSDVSERLQTPTAERPHKSGFGEKEFTRNQVLYEHLQVHTAERPHQCELCDKAFATKQKLNQHLQTHNEERSHKCGLCNKTYAGRNSLQKHLKIHSGARPHKCTYCDKGFALKDYLQKHLQIHNSEKLQKCKVCSKRFKRKDDLAQHLKIHISERSYKCEYCNKTFLRKENLKEHVRIHTGEKPLQCTYCDKTFRFRTALKRHLDQHVDHGDQKGAKVYNKQKH